MTVLKVYNPTTSQWEPALVGDTGPTAIVNTNGDAGDTLYVGSTDPTVSHTPAVGDIWIRWNA